MSLDHYDSFWRQSRTGTAYRTGIVVAQRMAPPAVRVQFAERQNIKTFWLPVLGTGSQNNKDFWMPDLGEQVAVLMDANDEDGAVVGTVWSTVDTIAGMTPDKRHFIFSDGTVLEYDRSTHVLTVQLGVGGSIMASNPAGARVNMDAAGNINTTAGAGALCTFSANGAAVLDALALVSKLVAAHNAHIHPFTDTAGDTGPTGPPSAPWVPATIQSDLCKTSG